MRMWEDNSVNLKVLFSLEPEIVERLQKLLPAYQTSKECEDWDIENLLNNLLAYSENSFIRERLNYQEYKHGLKSVDDYFKELESIHKERCEDFEIIKNGYEATKYLENERR